VRLRLRLRLLVACGAVLCHPGAWAAIDRHLGRVRRLSSEDFALGSDRFWHSQPDEQA
jgi:hypothetical protein